MYFANTFPEGVDYRVVLVQPDSHMILTVDTADGHHLFRLRISPQARPAHALQGAMKSLWGLNILIVHFLAVERNSPLLAVAELLSPNKNILYTPVYLRQIPNTEMNEQVRTQVQSLLSNEAKESLNRVGWIDECIRWVELTTGHGLSSKGDIEQHHAGGAFSLIRFHLDDGRSCWLKAVGAPNAHELPLTLHLSKLCEDHLPTLIASNPTWGAWLMWEGGAPMAALSYDPQDHGRMLASAAEAMARLQVRTQGQGISLLRAGAFDQSAATLHHHLGSLMDYLEEAMSLQTSTKAPLLRRAELDKIIQMLALILERVQALPIPDSIVHGDLNRGNILFRDDRCQFIDWSEAYVGHPLISLQHLLLLNRAEKEEPLRGYDATLKSRYREIWSLSCDPNAFDEGFIYMPLLAAFSTLYGRGDWFDSPVRYDPHRQAYARSLARAMNRAAQAPELLERLCA